MILLKHLPLKNIYVNSPYGKRDIIVNGKYYWWHNGLDLKAQIDTPVFAVANGKVMSAKYDNSYGNYITIDHGNYGSLYGHLSHYIYKEGSIVKYGDIIAYTGDTGDTTGPHLHFEIRLGDYKSFWDRVECDKSVFMNTVDPMIFIEELLRRDNEITVNEAIDIVQSAARLEDKTMDYMARYYKYGEDLVKKLARIIR